MDFAGEATLSTAYQTHHKASPNLSDVPHILFDYHAEGGAKNLEKLKVKVGESLLFPFPDFADSQPKLLLKPK